MKLSKIPKDELELMGYDDIALLVLQENGKKMKLRDIFVKVCKALDLSDDTVDAQLVDFFEQMSINKKFIMLKNGFWDLQTRHKLDIVIEDEEDDEIVDEGSADLEADIDAEEAENEDIFYDKEDETEDTDEDELADLVVIDEEDESNM